MAWGELCRWNADRGYGFVKSDYPIQEDVFIHHSVLRRAGIEPIIGTQLEFDVEPHDLGPRVKRAKRLRTWRDLADTAD